MFKKIGRSFLELTCFIFYLCFKNNTKEAVSWKCSVKKICLEISQNSQETTRARVSFSIKLQASTCNFFKRDTLAQVFSCEFCEISKNTHFYRTPPVAVSDTGIRLFVFIACVLFLYVCFVRSSH